MNETQINALRMKNGLPRLTSKQKLQMKNEQRQYRYELARKKVILAKMHSFGFPIEGYPIDLEKVQKSTRLLYKKYAAGKVSVHDFVYAMSACKKAFGYVSISKSMPDCSKYTHEQHKKEIKLLGELNAVARRTKRGRDFFADLYCDALFEDDEDGGCEDGQSRRPD